MPTIGSTGRAYIPLFNRVDSVVPLDTKILLPSARERPVDGGRLGTLSSWYDIDPALYSGKRDLSVLSVLESSRYLMTLIDREAALLGGDYERIFLGGFSEGCAMALWLFMKCRLNFGGLIGFSGYMFGFTDMIEGEKTNIPILLYHGKEDDRVDCEMAVYTYQRLKRYDMNVKVMLEPGLGHWISPRGEACMRYFFHNLMGEAEDLGDYSYSAGSNSHSSV